LKSRLCLQKFTEK